MLSISPNATAFSGYCMTRLSYEDEWQIAEDRDFSTCDRENQTKDQDDIFDPTGLIYWNSSNYY